MLVMAMIPYRGNQLLNIGRTIFVDVSRITYNVNWHNNLRKNIEFLYMYIARVLMVIYSQDSQRSGGRLNKKDGLTRYGDSHVKDKTS